MAEWEDRYIGLALREVIPAGHVPDKIEARWVHPQVLDDRPARRWIEEQMGQALDAAGATMHRVGPLLINEREAKRLRGHDPSLRFEPFAWTLGGQVLMITASYRAVAVPHEQWFLAECQGCRPVAPQPFRDEAARDGWATVHEQATGHQVERREEMRRVQAG